MINSNQIKEYMNLAKTTLAKGHPVNVCFSGPPGLAKSFMVNLWAKENGYKYLDLRLAAMEAPDVRGLQREVGSTGKLKYLLPDFWPERGKVVINLDEINRAPRANMNAVLSLLQERTVGDLTIGPEVIVVACINEGTEYDVNEMDAALKDRLLFVPVEYDHNTFVNFAEATGFNKDILGFLQAGLWTYKTPAQCQEKKYLSNRSWSRLNSAYDSSTEEMQRQILTLELGSELARTFLAWKADQRPLLFADFQADKKAAFKHLANLEERQDMLTTLVVDLGRAKTAKSNLPLYGEIMLKLPIDLAVKVFYDQLMHFNNTQYSAKITVEDYLKTELVEPLYTHFTTKDKAKLKAAVKRHDEAIAESETNEKSR